MVMLKSVILILGVICTITVIADDIDMIEAEEPVVPKAANEIPGLTLLAPHISLEDSILADGNDCFGFQPGVDILPGGDDVFLVSMCHEGGWQGDARAGVYKYNKDGNLLAGPVSASDNNEPFGFSTGWSIAAFADGGCVVTGVARFGLGVEEGIDLGVFDTPVSGFRVFDAELNPVTPLQGVWEPANQQGNDDRDGGGDRLRVARLSNDRFVIVLDIQSVNMQVQFGLTDTGETPTRKAAYRVFEQDGTPVGPSRWAFPMTDDQGGWGASQDDVDVVAGPDGSFAITAAAPDLLDNLDPFPVAFFDNNGEPIGEPFGVVDETLLDFGGIIEPGVVSPEIGYGGGVYALGVNLNLIGFGSNTMGLTLFDSDRNIIRSTYDGMGHKDLLPEVREGDLASDDSGNVFVINRSDQGIPGSSGDSDKIQFVRMHTNEGVPFSDPWVTFPIDVSGGSQRDPVIAANSNIVVVASLNEDIHPLGGGNSFGIYGNPMEQTEVGNWMIFQ